jgi:hypothetical protein
MGISHHLENESGVTKRTVDNDYANMPTEPVTVMQ